MGRPPEQPFLPEIRRARLDKLTIYEISDSELDVLERGSPDSVYLNVAIALLSVAISLTVTLITATIESARTFVVFVVCTVVCYVGGVVLLLVWGRSRGSVTACARGIRSRLPTIYDGDLLVFRADPSGTRQGKIVLAQYRGTADPETGGSFTVKRYSSEKREAGEGGWRHAQIVLSPINPDYAPIVIPAAEAEHFRILAEFIAVLRATP